MASCSSPNDAIRIETAFIRHIQVLILSGREFCWIDEKEHNRAAKEMRRRR
jgi:hypothetical protein